MPYYREAPCQYNCSVHGDKPNVIRGHIEVVTHEVIQGWIYSADGAIRAVHRGPLTAEIVEREILPALR